MVQLTESSYNEGCEVPSPCSHHLIKMKKSGKSEKGRKYGGGSKGRIIMIVSSGRHDIAKKSGVVKCVCEILENKV
jgi:hypothetical protein